MCLITFVVQFNKFGGIKQNALSYSEIATRYDRESCRVQRSTIRYSERTSLADLWAGRTGRLDGRHLRGMPNKPGPDCNIQKGGKTLQFEIIELARQPANGLALAESP